MQNTPPPICISLNKNSIYCYTPRSSKHTNTCNGWARVFCNPSSLDIWSMWMRRVSISFAILPNLVHLLPLEMILIHSLVQSSSFLHCQMCLCPLLNYLGDCYRTETDFPQPKMKTEIHF